MTPEPPRSHPRPAASFSANLPTGVNPPHDDEDATVRVRAAGVCARLDGAWYREVYRTHDLSNAKVVQERLIREDCAARIMQSAGGSDHFIRWFVVIPPDPDADTTSGALPTSAGDGDAASRMAHAEV